MNNSQPVLSVQHHGDDSNETSFNKKQQRKRSSIASMMFDSRLQNSVATKFSPKTILKPPDRNLSHGEGRTRLKKVYFKVCNMYCWFQDNRLFFI